MRTNPVPTTPPARHTRTEEIALIQVLDGRRVCKTMNGFRHGLGSVGEPIGPYLSHRVRAGYSEGIDLRLPFDIRDLKIQIIRMDRPRRKNGLYPARAISWGDLGAIDAPTMIEAQVLADRMRAEDSEGGR